MVIRSSEDLDTFVHGLLGIKGIGPKSVVRIERMTQKVFKKTGLIENFLFLLRVGRVGYKIYLRVLDCLHFSKEMYEFHVVIGFVYNELLSAQKNGHSFLNYQLLKENISNHLMTMEECLLVAHLKKAHGKRIIEFDHSEGIVSSYGSRSLVKKSVEILDEKAYRKAVSEEEFYCLQSALDDSREALERKSGIEFSDEQKYAAIRCLTNELNFICAPPGTGKTFLLGLIGRTIINSGKSLSILCPTHVSVDQIFLSTGLRAQTISSYLKLSEEDGDEELILQGQISGDEDYIIIDEGSLVDEKSLARIVLKSRDNTKLIFVGDPYQIRSVLPGDYLKLVKRYKSSRLVLTENFRNKDSEILRLFSDLKFSTGISQTGVDSYRTSDIDWHNCHSHEQFVFNFDLLVTKYGLDNITLLTPKKSGLWGQKNIDDLIYENYNVRGIVKTVSSYQGAEAENVILILNSSHTMFHSREIIYTAATRTKGCLHFFCDKSYFKLNNRKRNTLVN